MTDKHNVYELLRTLLSQSEIECSSHEEMIEVLHKTRDEIYNEIDNIKRFMELITSYAVAKTNYKGVMDDLHKRIDFQK